MDLYKPKLVAMLLACAVAPSSGTVVADSLTEAFSEGSVKANILLRYETVDDDTRSRDADAVTLRTRLGYETGSFHGWKLFAEIEDVTAIDDSYNSTTNGNTQYPVVADPEETELNRLTLSYSGFADTWIKAGRQRIILDNARFIGNVGWRQNEQTFDGLKITNSSLADTKLTYAYLTKAHRIFGDNSRAGNSDMNSHLLNVAYSGLELGKLTAYGYWLGFDDNSAIGPGAGTRTLGVSFDGSKLLNDDFKLIYRAELADQSDYDDGASTNDADYQLGELGIKYKKFTVKVGQETLEGDGTYGFSTQLATGHKFNGWADNFLATPRDGLEDTYVTAIGWLGGVKLLATYHWFESDKDSYDYGEELNLLAVKKINKQFTVGAKYADYETDTNSALLARVGGTGPAAIDREKFWLWGAYQF
ncbi:MAG: alginate export family protein [Immundisolibacteraceae bacterium]|nr:alginate export family protein [Immundisolibacteraceae bacterium]